MKQIFIIAYSFLFVHISTQKELKLPKYIKTCGRNDPNYTQCVLDNANYAIPYIVKGDREFGFPSVNPLRLPIIEIEQKNFKLVLRDVLIWGLETIKVTKLNLDRSIFDAIFYIDNLNIVGTYNVDGKVLLLNLQGEGPANITGVGGVYKVKSQLSSIKKNGITYFKFGKPNVEFTLKRAYFDFGNLLNGDEKFGSEINNILNANWESVLQDMGAPIKETVSALIQTVASKIVEKYPQNLLILEI